MWKALLANRSVTVLLVRSEGKTVGVWWTLLLVYDRMMVGMVPVYWRGIPVYLEDEFEFIFFYVNVSTNLEDPAFLFHGALYTVCLL